MIFTVLILFGGVSIVALSAMTPQELAGSWATDPMAGIAHAISVAITPEEVAAGLSSNEAGIIVFTWILTGLRDVLPALVAILAASILFLGTNAGLMGISRLAFSLGRNQLIPSTLGRVHHRFKTPYISIIIFAGAAIVILVPGLFAPGVLVDLGALYVFGSLLAFILAHTSILRLRVKRPDLPRPFKLGWNIKFKQWQLPITAILGLAGTGVIWLVVIATQPYSRWIGITWMVIGLGVYILYRQRKKLPLNQMNDKPASSILNEEQLHK